MFYEKYVCLGNIKGLNKFVNVLRSITQLKHKTFTFSDRSGFPMDYKLNNIRVVS